MTTKEERILEAVRAMADAGLFAAPLNNGDWMVGRASYLYSIRIDQNHYEDRNLCIASCLPEAVNAFISKLKVDHAHLRE